MLFNTLVVSPHTYTNINCYIKFDIFILRTELGYATTVYRKPAASDQYIHYTSAQAWKEKAPAICTLKERACEYCSDETLLAE